MADRLRIGIAPLLAAAAYALSQPPFELAPFGWLVAAPLVWGAFRRHPALALAQGILFGVLFGYLVAGWLGAMAADYFEAPAPWPWLGVFALFASTAGLPFGAMLAWYAWSSRRGRISPIAWGAAFALAEALRAQGPLPNPFALLATSQVPWPLALQASAVVGPHGLAWLLAASGAALAMALDPRLRAQSRPRELALVGAAVVAVLGLGAWRLADPPPTAGVEVALLQGGRPALRPGEPGVEQQIQVYLDLSREAAEDGAELVLWPEMAVGFDVMSRLRERLAVAELARELDVDLVFGGLGWNPEAEAWANRAYLQRAGVWAGHQDKVVLMPFSETPWPPDGADPSGFAAGTSTVPLRSRFAPLGILICSEAAHPAFARRVVASGAELLVNPSNDAWFPTPAAARQQFFGAVLRAVENGRPLLRPTTNGVTAIVDRFGRILRELPRDEPGSLHGWLRPHQEPTVYHRFGDAPALCLALFALLADAWRQRASRNAG